MPWLFYCLGLFAVVIYGGSFSPLGQAREEQNIHNQLPQQARQTFTYLTALNDWRYSHPLENGTIDARQLGIPLSNHLKIRSSTAVCGYGNRRSPDCLTPCWPKAIARH